MAKQQKKTSQSTRDMKRAVEDALEEGKSMIVLILEEQPTDDGCAVAIEEHHHMSSDFISRHMLCSAISNNGAYKFINRMPQMNFVANLLGALGDKIKG